MNERKLLGPEDQLADRIGKAIVIAIVVVFAALGLVAVATLVLRALF